MAEEKRTEKQRKAQVIETSVHDARAMISLVSYGLLDVLMRIDVADGHKSNAKDAVFNIDAEGLEAAWGCLETVRAAREKLDAAMTQF